MGPGELQLAQQHALQVLELLLFMAHVNTMRHVHVAVDVSTTVTSPLQVTLSSAQNKDNETQAKTKSLQTLLEPVIS